MTKRIEFAMNGGMFHEDGDCILKIVMMSFPLNKEMEKGIFIQSRMVYLQLL